MNTIHSDKDSEQEMMLNESGGLNFSGEVVRLAGVSKVGQDLSLNDSDFVNAQKLAQLDIRVELNDQ